LYYKIPLIQGFLAIPNYIYLERSDPMVE